ncbi:copper resistance protein NlpE N-terminal domain-containing protein [Flavihumibacter rivuli]|uniref:META domain-containing protein n=1 Tax=Flavihumibacter rivuli TaxID=2838156 RepID=UPI001BDF4C73|nr:META domain-containing protein [Flavihumibacter rivuli]ULQ56704.1 copper resistance protein NlpE N-terminal domain-containing protein [Flavihumibacter rivuli]
MKLLSSLITSIAVLAFYSACKPPENTGTNKPAGDNSQTSLDWDGVYTGVLPCADCEGLETVVMLNKDNTYSIQRRYKGKSTDIVSKTGKFSWNKEGGKVILEGENPGTFQVGENALIQLDMDGNKITGELASKYVLSKVQPGITEKYWKLVEINGKPVVKNEQMRREPFIILKAEGNKVNGNGGCNNIMGTYEIKEGNRISFGKMASTMMACPDMTIEDAFKKVLESADNFSLNGDKMSLNKARMAPLARFEAVYLY